jgi:hypothetical protein
MVPAGSGELTRQQLKQAPFATTTHRYADNLRALMWYSLTIWLLDAGLHVLTVDQCLGATVRRLQDLWYFCCFVYNMTSSSYFQDTPFILLHADLGGTNA